MLRYFTVLGIILIIFTGCGRASALMSPAIPPQQPAISSVPGSKVMDGIPANGAAAVVTETVTDVFVKPDVKSERITQVIYNQPVSIIDETGGWVRLATSDGIQGWVRSKFIERSVSSIFGRTCTHRIVVTGKDKSIFSDPSGGITVKDAVMGTVFMAFNNSGNAYEVYLPGNLTGWLRGSGIIHVGLDADVPVTSGKDFAASAMKFKGTSYLLNGLSSMGIDSPGMLYICAKVNGLNLPRDLKGQTNCGEEIMLDDVNTGDLVFLVSPEDDKSIASAGIYMGNGQYIHASKTSGYVRLDGLNESGSDGKPVFARRIFR